MKVFRGSKAAARKLKRPVVTMGVFDGMHRGHQHIFQKCLRRAKKIDSHAVVYTFEPHPVSVLSPAAAPPLLTTLEQKLALFEECGFDATVVEPFDKRFSQLSPENFFKKIIVGHLQTKELYVGYDFTFGAHRSGTTEILRQLGDKNNIGIHVIDAYLLNECLVSSTEIRKRVQAGDMKMAKQLLGRPYCIFGTIVRGEGLGTQIGIPTANLKPENELLPDGGVYATYSYLRGKRYPSVTNIGTRPTFEGKELRVESHLLHFKRQVVGKTMRLDFLKRLRDEIRFASAEELVKQIHHDIETAQRYFQNV